MDRRTILAIAIITLILIGYPYYIEMISPPEPEPVPEEITRQRPSRKPVDTVKELPKEEIKPKAAIEAPLPDKNLAANANIVEDSTTISIRYETKLISAEITNKNGANLTSWKMLKYAGADSLPVDMINGNHFSVEFNDWNGDFVDLSLYSFFLESDNEEKGKRTIRFYLPYKGGRITKTYIFNSESYDYKLILGFEGLSQDFIGKQYSLTWKNGVPPAEPNVQEDASYASAQVRIAGDLEIYNDAGENPVTVEGQNIQWAAARIKYFTIATVPLSDDLVTSVKLSGEMTDMGEIQYGEYSYSMNVRHPVPTSSDTFLVYLGPLAYERLEEYGADLEDMVLGSSGYERFFRPFSLFLLQILKWLHAVIPNYGVAIIVFSSLLKIVLVPFTRSSYKSMKAMQKLQPEMKALKEKFKNDAQAMQKKTMELYKEHKVNPMGGCLPMILQMPVLFAMYILFRSTVQLRGEAFFGWITDLSRPDTVMLLPFTIPFYGDMLNILPILMAGSMFLQQRQTIQDQNQKMMMYFMPIMMLFIFNQFPSGLNLYYTVFNLLTIAQQHFIKISDEEFKFDKPKKNSLAFGNVKKK